MYTCDSHLCALEELCGHCIYACTIIFAKIEDPAYVCQNKTSVY